MSTLLRPIIAKPAAIKTLIYKKATTLRTRKIATLIKIITLKVRAH
jgi:hypothetical protein